MRSSLIVILFLFVSFYSSAQNGWTRKKNGFYAQTSLTTFSSNRYYSLTGDLNTGGSTLLSHSLHFYGEYGIIDQLTVLLDFPALRINHFNTTDMAIGAGSAKVGLKYKFFKNFPFALQVDLDIPTDDGINYATSKEQNLFGTYDQINLPTSDGEFNVWTTLAISQSTSSGNTFGSLYAGANWRTKNFSHQFQAGLEIGQLLWNRWYIIGKFKIQESFSNGSAFASFVYGEGTTFSEYNLTNIVKLNDHWKILVGASDFIGFPIKRRNLYDGFTFFAGVSIEY